MAGFSAGAEEEVRAQLGDTVRVGTLSIYDTVARDLVQGADVILFRFPEGEPMAYRLATLLGDEGVPCAVLAVGPEPSREVFEALPTLRRVPEPLDFSYLRGVVDTAQLGRARMRRLDKEQNRVRALYEISSALLKVTHRKQVARALEETLPRLVNASMILISMPLSSTPLVYFWSSEAFGADRVGPLRQHLRQAWDALRPNEPVEWTWLTQLAIDRGEGTTRTLRHSSFASAPITRGSATEGFLTVLPSSDRPQEEAALQTFFLIGDLLSVLMHNLHLKDKLEERATHDGLTGLLNRQTFMETLDKECRRASRYKQPLALVMLDLDHFKQVNDHHGHQAGDEALRTVAGTIRSSIRDTDFAGRCGGEEFMVLLPNTPEEGARIWAERLRRNVETTPIPTARGPLRITASMGVAAAEFAGAETDSLVAHADKALYSAKARGRNRVVSASTLSAVPDDR